MPADMPERAENQGGVPASLDGQKDGGAYAGETARRRFGAAMVLNLALPGLGYVYCGRPVTGAVLGVLLVAPTALLVAVGWRVGIFMAKPLGLGLLLCAYVHAGMAVDLWRLCRRQSAYVLAPYNHPVVYGSAIALLSLLPAVLGASLVRHHVAGTLDVADLGMYPRLLPGDRIYFDRGAYRNRKPARGELVVARLPGEGLPRVLRVVGLPGEVVAMRGSDVLVDGALLAKEPYARVHLSPSVVRAGDGRAIVATTELTADQALHYAVFHGADRASPDAMSPGTTGADSTGRDTVGPVDLGPDQLFLLGDYRDGGGMDCRQTGPVSLADVLGRPRHVFLSRDPDGAVRWERLGLSADARPLPSQ